MHCEHWTWTWETLRIASPYWPHSLAPFIAFATGQSPKNDTSGTSIRTRLRATSIGSPAVYRTTSLRPLLTHIYVVSGIYIICYNCHSSLHTSLNARHTHKHSIHTQSGECSECCFASHLTEAEIAQLSSTLAKSHGQRRLLLLCHQLTVCLKLVQLQ